MGLNFLLLLDGINLRNFFTANTQVHFIYIGLITAKTARKKVIYDK